MLETEIKRLNENIAHLNKLLETMVEMTKSPEPITATFPSPQVEAEPSPAPTAEKPEKKSVTEFVDEHCEKVKEEVASKSEASTYSTDDIKSMALAISRKDRSKQKDIKAKLAEHDAKVANDLKGEGLQEVGEWLSALKEDMGA